ncbi:hypothetical protein DIPPA_22730 [Diplonema papillatum]|nr:hypothetical protein DIPPA_22730 [Diplonema papillatum]
MVAVSTTSIGAAGAAMCMFVIFTANVNDGRVLHQQRARAGAALHVTVERAGSLPGDVEAKLLALDAMFEPSTAARRDPQPTPPPPPPPVRQRLGGKPPPAGGFDLSVQSLPTKAQSSTRRSLQAWFDEEQQRTRGAYFAHFDRLRRDNLRKVLAQARVTAEAALAQVPAAYRSIVGDVCAAGADDEERAVCTARGARIVDNLLAHFPGGANQTGIRALNRPAAALQVGAYHARNIAVQSKRRHVTHFEKQYGSKAHFVRLSIAAGVIIERQTIGFRRGRAVYWNKDELVALAWVQSVLNTMPPALRKEITCEVILQEDDRCEAFDPAYNSPALKTTYPTVAFSKNPAWCPHYTVLTWDSIIQSSRLSKKLKHASPPEPALPFEALKSKMSFRGTGWGPDRYLFAMVSNAGVMPYLDVGLTYNNTASCRETMEPLVNGERPNFLQKTAFVQPAAACAAAGGGSPFKSRDLGGSASEKYSLLLDGNSALFRTARALGFPGVPIIHTFSNYSLSYYEDLTPFVHYVPIQANLTVAPHELDHVYHWLEANPAVAKDIATRSSSFAAKNLDDKSGVHYRRDWRIFLRVLSGQYQTPARTLHKRAADLREQPFSCPPSAEGRMDVFAKQGFHPKVVSWAVEFGMHDLACGAQK